VFKDIKYGVPSNMVEPKIFCKLLTLNHWWSWFWDPC